MNDDRVDGMMEQVNRGLALNRLHKDLAELYRGKSTDQVLIKQLWAKIEELEAL